MVWNIYYLVMHGESWILDVRRDVGIVSHPFSWGNKWKSCNWLLNNEHMGNRYNQIIGKHILNLIESNKRFAEDYWSFGNTKIGIADGETP